MQGKTLFWRPEGPRIAVGWGRLYVSDLNPETNICFRISRWELANIGWRLLWSAITGSFK